MRRITDTSVMSYQALGICSWYLSILEPFWYVNVHVILRPACAVEQKQMISVRYFNVKSKMEELNAGRDSIDCKICLGFVSGRGSYVYIWRTERCAVSGKITVF